MISRVCDSPSLEMISVSRKSGFDAEYLERPAGQGEEPPFARVYAIKRGFAERGRVDAATLEELVDLLVGQYHIDGIGRFPACNSNFAAMQVLI